MTSSHDAYIDTYPAHPTAVFRSSIQDIQYSPERCITTLTGLLDSINGFRATIAAEMAKMDDHIRDIEQQKIGINTCLDDLNEVGRNIEALRQGIAV
jgi:hypothetical protein